MKMALAETGVREVRIPVPGGELRGDLELPEHPVGLVLFAHGSGSSRKSPRNRRVAAVLRGSGLGTLLFDLLSEREEAVDLRTAEHRFDIPLLAQRLEAAADWVASDSEIRALPLGYFGASTGAAAALVAAARRPAGVLAVVSRGGRPDLADRALGEVRSPTLLIVGSEDDEVLALNRQAMARMSAPVELRIVEGATHLFEEPGALDEVSEIAAEWLRATLARPRSGGSA
jgi:putative phosphoribosyl transferase